MRGRDRGRDEQPGQPAVGVAAERAVADAPRGRPGRAGASRPGSRRAARRSVPMWSITLNASEVMNGSFQPSRYGTMIRCAGRRDRQELGESLHDPHDQRLDERVHRSVAPRVDARSPAR